MDGDGAPDDGRGGAVHWGILWKEHWLWSQIDPGPSLKPDSAVSKLCNPEQVTTPLWASVSAPGKWAYEPFSQLWKASLRLWLKRFTVRLPSMEDDQTLAAHLGGSQSVKNSGAGGTIYLRR